MKSLNRHVVKHAAHKWRDLVVQLLQSNQVVMMMDIASNHPHDAVRCCKEVFFKWLDPSEDASWHKLIRALRSPTIQLNYLADQLEQMMSTECKIYVCM